MVHSVSIVLSSACCPASPTLRSCSTCPCCFRGELAAAPLQCTRTVVTDTHSMALAGEPILPFCFAAHPHRLDENRYRDARQPTAAHAAQRHDKWRAADRSTHGVRHAASSDGAQHQCSSAPARSLRSWRGLAALEARGGRSASAPQRTPSANLLRLTRCVRMLACACPGGGWHGTLQRVRHVAPVAAVG